MAQPHRRMALTLFLTACIAGCSERPPAPAAQPDQRSSAPFTPVEHEPTMEEKAQQENVLKAELAAGATPANYVASFEDGALVRIAEERSPPGAVLRGDYAFHGARLVKYSGASLQSDATLEVHFDTQGGITSASGSAGAPADAEISAIRNRAQLLRSHALARKATRDHGGTH